MRLQEHGLHIKGGKIPQAGLHLILGGWHPAHKDRRPVSPGACKPAKQRGILDLNLYLDNFAI
jgi:hypothetical protein